MRTQSRAGTFLLVAGAVTISSAALALQQPDNTVIPTGNGLQGLFAARAEAIDALNDAATTPETFTPTCGLTFEVLQRNAGFSNSFGWYNVTGVKPTASELHEFLSCNDPVGTVRALNIKNDPNYVGGDIGFYQAAGPGCPTAASNQNLFFSEKKYNPDGSQMNPYIHLLTYNSTVTDRAFYFAWEDLLSGGDNDFDDLTTFVTGIRCTGGGAPCDTGLLGVCAQGILQCQSGALACVPQFGAMTEQCDGFDNDCNDVIDEGDLCNVDFVCDQGNCVPECNSAEFPCTGNRVCDDRGYCVDPQCLNVTCPSGEKCVAGDCLGPCENVVCPFGQVCQLGVCLDPCGPITCDAEQVCVSGVCVDQCQCAGCPPTDTCQPDGRCVVTSCVGVTCAAGEHCENGSCIDNCAGVTCPLGQSCELGACVTSAEGGAGGVGGSSGVGFVGGGGNGSGGSTGGAGTTSGGAPATGGGGGRGASSGCDCRVGEGEATGSESSWMAALGLFACALLRRRTSVPR